ncbi:MAG: AtpZ/AtpI family protein [Ignavibacteriales bacterium]|nr:AtpZ/AtpI family protein [Ignavibacteriales bacterium]
MNEPSQPGEPKKSDPEPSDLRQTYRDIAPYLTLGFQLAAAVVGFFLIGWWLDTRYYTSPWFKLTGLLLGSVGGMIKFFRSVSTLNKQDHS